MSDYCKKYDDLYTLPSKTMGARVDMERDKQRSLITFTLLCKQSSVHCHCNFHKREPLRLCCH